MPLARFQADALFKLTREHLLAEEACLAALLMALRGLKISLGGRGWGDLQARIDDLSPLAAERDRLKQARGELRRKLNEVIPDVSAPLDVLATYLPGTEAKALNELRTRVRRHVRIVNEEARSTSFLAEHHLAFFQSFFQELTRPAPGAARYGPGGELQRGAPSTLLQVRG